MEITNTAAGSTATGGTRRQLLNSDFDTFLRMLTTQMQNQDPLNPMDSTQFAQQMASFSTVEQQMRTNQMLETVSSQLGLMNMAQLSGWIGMEVRVPAPVRFTGGTVTLSPNPAALADRAVLVVRDADGRTVSREDIALTAETLDWGGTAADGAPLPHGTYSFELESYSGDSLLGTNTVEVYAPVLEARSTGGGIMLMTPGDISVAAGAVSALRRPG